MYKTRNAEQPAKSAQIHLTDSRAMLGQFLHNKARNHAISNLAKWKFKVKPEVCVLGRE
jgi:hypothetical protein